MISVSAISFWLRTNYVLESRIAGPGHSEPNYLFYPPDENTESMRVLPFVDLFLVIVYYEDLHVPTEDSDLV